MKEAFNFISEQELNEFQKENRFFERTIRLSDETGNNDIIEISNFLNSNYKSFFK